MRLLPVMEMLSIMIWFSLMVITFSNRNLSPKQRMRMASTLTVVVAVVMILLLGGDSIWYQLASG